MMKNATLSQPKTEDKLIKPSTPAAIDNRPLDSFIDQYRMNEMNVG